MSADTMSSEPLLRGNVSVTNLGLSPSISGNQGYGKAFVNTELIIVSLVFTVSL